MKKAWVLRLANNALRLWAWKILGCPRERKFISPTEKPAASLQRAFVFDHTG
jgi:hypothetical protein